MNLPVTFTDKMKKLLGNEYEEYIACYDETRLYGLRVNTKKISVEEFKQICPFEIDNPLHTIRIDKQAKYFPVT